MTKEAFDAIKAGLEDAVAYSEGDRSKGKTHQIAAAPEVDVLAIRKRTGLSRVRFAAKFGLDPRAVQEWEQGRRRPDRAAALLLRIIDREPEVVERALGEAA